MPIANELFNPLDKHNLAQSIANAIYNRDAYCLDSIEVFEGAGIYAIYYLGDFPLYSIISEKNKKELIQPIYAGKAVPEGSRKGGLGIDIPVGNYLYKRLNEHRKSIESAKNLSIKHFMCRFLTVDDIWIPLGESLLIERTKPLWNVVVDGFGNHDPGSGRHKQQKSSWDVLHPGRSWAERLEPGKSIKEISDSIKKSQV